MHNYILSSATRYVSKIVLTLALMLAATQTIYADSMKLGYCEGNAVSFYPAAKESPAGGSAVFFPETLMQAYSGTDIVSFHIWSSIMEPSTVHFAIRSSLDGGEALYEQTATLEKYGWNEVRLDKPFRIDGKAFYMSYLVEGILNIPYALSLVDGEEYICTDGSEWKPSVEGFSAAFYATVESDNLPRCNVSLGNIVMPGYARLGEPLTFSGDFINLGSVPVESLTFTYHVGDSLATETVSVTEVKPRGTGTFEMNGLRILSEGEPQVSVEISAVNGEADFDPSDNTSRTKQVLCRSVMPQRKVLLEVFSTERCTNCPTVHKQISAVADTCERIIELGHHAGFYEDNYTIAASKEYEWFYKEGRLYAPAVMLDRTEMSDNYPDIYSDGVPVVSVGASKLKTLYAEQSCAPAFVSVEPTVKTDKSGNILIHVEGEQLIDTDVESPRLFVFVSEDSVYSTNQSGASGGYYHRHMARQSVTPTWGEPIDIKGYTADYTVPVQAGWDAARLSVVAFVANYDAEDKNNCRVLNAEEAKVPYEGVAGIESAVAKPMHVSWDGSTLMVKDGFSRLTVCDMSGRQVYSATADDTADLGFLDRGYYIATIVCGNGQKVMKLMAD